MEVAIIAVVNKLITMDITHTIPGALIGIGVIRFGLSESLFNPQENSLIIRKIFSWLLEKKRL